MDAVRTDEAHYEALRRRMVEEQIRARGVRDPRVLQAMAEVPRHLFVEEGLRRLAYEDSALPIGHGQTISQPLMVAVMTECLELRGEERVLVAAAAPAIPRALVSQLVEGGIIAIPVGHLWPAQTLPEPSNEQRGTRNEQRVAVAF